MRLVHRSIDRHGSGYVQTDHILVNTTTHIPHTPSHLTPSQTVKWCLFPKSLRTCGTCIILSPLETASSPLPSGDEIYTYAHTCPHTHPHGYRKVKDESSTGSSTTNRVRTTLTITVENIEFDTAACELRVKGRNIQENQYVKVRSFCIVNY